MSKLTIKTELRHLNQADRRKIENLLNAAESWIELIKILPKELDSLDDESQTPTDHQGAELLIDNQKYKLLEQQRYIASGSPSKALLDYWSTYGKRRPTIEHLIYYSSKCHLNRLVNYLVVDLLKMDPTNYRFAPKEAHLDDEFKSQEHDLIAAENSRNDASTLFEHQEQLNTIRTLSFSLIKKYTNNFSEINLQDGGCKIGEGGFGKVYLARLPKFELKDTNLDCELDSTGSNYLIAVKVVPNQFENQYFNELKYLNDFKHPNLLNLVGLSYFGDSLCILSEYMINGSLQDCLLSTNAKPLDYNQRITIIRQMFDAICHLHTFKEQPLIHRDIKSSNILLDRNFNGKLCDFGLARSGALNSKTVYTKNIIGTSMYMPPEVLRGDISVQNDTFSFGIILIELLTGLPPIVSSNDTSKMNQEQYTDILTFANENIFEVFEDNESIDDEPVDCEQIVGQYLDKRAGEWNLSRGVQLFDLARKATNYVKMKRPTMVKLREHFEQIMS